MLSLPALRKALNLELLFLLKPVGDGDMDGHFEDPYLQVFLLFLCHHSPSSRLFVVSCYSIFSFLITVDSNTGI